MFRFYLLVAIFITTLNGTMAQETEWAPIGAKWYHLNYEANISTSIISESVKDTVIKDIVCRKIVSNYYAENGDSVRSSSEIFTYEEDAIVYYYELERDSFMILYDFNLEAGRTINYSRILNDEEMEVEATIDSIVQKQLPSGQDIYFYFISPEIVFDGRDGYYHFIGASGVLFVPALSFSIIGATTILTCYRNGEEEYKFLDLPCELISSTSPVDYSSEVTIFPTLTSELINVNIKNDFAPDSYQVFSSIGQEIIFEKWTKNSFQISTNNWEKGIYFILIKSKNSFVSKRVIKY